MPEGFGLIFSFIALAFSIATLIKVRRNRPVQTGPPNPIPTPRPRPGGELPLPGGDSAPPPGPPPVLRSVGIRAGDSSGGTNVGGEISIRAFSPEYDLLHRIMNAEHGETVELSQEDYQLLHSIQDGHVRNRDLSNVLGTLIEDLQAQGLLSQAGVEQEAQRMQEGIERKINSLQNDLDATEKVIGKLVEEAEPVPEPPSWHSRITDDDDLV